MKLHDVINELGNKLKIETTLNCENNTFIKGIACSSDKVNRGDCFVAIKGFNKNGHDYIASAIENGASVVIGEKNTKGFAHPYIQVQNSRRALAIISSQFYNSPSTEKLVIGITGTNGKTTTSYLLRHILESTGKSCTVIGSIQNIVNGEERPTPNTTPNSLETNRLLFESNDEIAIIEVTQYNYGNEKGRVIRDRTLAIKYALEIAEEGDWILVTGKGSEKYQQRFSLPCNSDEELVKYLAYKNE